MKKSVARCQHEQAEATASSRRRRHFSHEYKIQILQEANRCQHGGINALLEREQLHRSQLTRWRKELQEVLSHNARDQREARKDSEQDQSRDFMVERLWKEIISLRRQLAVANQYIELQRETLAILKKNHTG